MTEKTIYALGFFDGVHVGHQALLAACRQLADKTGAKAGAVTFTNHPDGLVQGRTPNLINTPQDRKMLLQHYMDTVLELPFDRAMMNMPWQDFFAMLCRDHHARGLVCGEDFRFGRRGEGNSEKLRSACEAAGIPCVIVPQQRVDGTVVSSTHIRTLLEEGRMEEAVRFLGHPHVLTGQVVKGRQLGRTIGIPTANLEQPQGVVQLRHGVYACQVCVQGRRYGAVTNVGSRPTVNGKHVTVEPWILDYEADLYGQTLTLEFYQFLRPEQKFDSLESLQEEILKNAAQTRKIFEKT